MRKLKEMKTDDEKYLIRLKQGLGSLKRCKTLDKYEERLEEIRKYEPDYNPNETAKERFKRKHEIKK